MVKTWISCYDGQIQNHLMTNNWFYLLASPWGQTMIQGRFLCREKKGGKHLGSVTKITCIVSLAFSHNRIKLVLSPKRRYCLRGCPPGTKQILHLDPSKKTKNSILFFFNLMHIFFFFFFHYKCNKVFDWLMIVTASKILIG